MISLRRKHRYLLSILSGILMVISFPYTGSLTPVAFISWIPLLLVESNISKQNYRSRKVLVHAYLTFLIYNLGSTWWVWNASEGGAVLAFVLNTLIMAIVFYLFHLTKKHVGNKEGYIGLIFYWLAFEYFHYNWESSWPWLSFGNVFSITPSWVQWYSYSGVLGGTLWVLLINLLLFRAYDNVLLKGEKWRIQTPFFYLSTFVFIVPLAISLISYYSYEEKKDPINVVALQPNIDPYNEKFNTSTVDQLKKMLKQLAPETNATTDLVVGPETAIGDNVDEESFKQSYIYSLIRSSNDAFENASVLWGAATYRLFDNKNSYASVPLEHDDGFVEYYNSSLFIDGKKAPEFIHKSKLVPGVEKLPFLKYFPFMSDWSIDMGGTTVNLGVETEPKVFETDQFKLAPVICYESIFGEFVSQQCNKGAEVICIVTNDGWWKDTPGYKQHTSFARLRAIENRRSVVRSANTGTSCFINQRGDILQQTEWWVPDVISGEINLNKELSFYTKYGNVIGRSSAFVMFFLLLFTFVKRFKKLVAK